jgi:hypothetical protein
MGAQLFHADGRKDMTKLIGDFLAILRMRLTTNRLPLFVETTAVCLGTLLGLLAPGASSHHHCFFTQIINFKQDRQCTYLLPNTKARSRHNCRGKSIIIYLSECVSARAGAWVCTCVSVRVPLFIQHATCMGLTAPSFVAPPAPPHFSTLSHKRHNFRKTSLNIKCVFDFLYNFYLKHFSF